MSTLPPYLITLVEQSEGLRLQAYQDCCGIWTIGYGQTGQDIHQGMTITPQEAQERLQLTLQGLWSAITQHSTVTLEPWQTAALCDFSYNLGLAALLKSTLWRYVQQQDTEAAAQQFHLWVYAAGKPQAGLIARRSREALMFLGHC